MFVVIFRAKVRSLDEEYSRVAARLRDLALNEFGCLEFHSVSEDRNEVALSYWASEEDIRAWKLHPEHIAAQTRGKAVWYESHSVQIASITREYGAGT